MDAFADSLYRAAVCSWNGDIFIFGGVDSDNWDSVQMYSTGRDVWTSLDRMPEGRYGAYAFADEDSIHLLGGAKRNADATDLITFNPATGQWTVSNFRLPLELRDFACVTVRATDGSTDQPIASFSNLFIQATRRHSQPAALAHVHLSPVADLGPSSGSRAVSK
ncbi:unnamed protein product [Protopolystoma xenopodis]|uniref:Kelch repeat protein n=1 Tax=Protopolystoma xenopodis TaxID=117903 RepID=A0A3S4ZV69_9PLAT|nr:unnamed protein product [Protopolystoma xenopodis]